MCVLICCMCPDVKKKSNFVPRKENLAQQSKPDWRFLEEYEDNCFSFK